MGVKLEVGKYYRGRDGAKWYVGMRIPNAATPECEFTGYDEEGSLGIWGECGKFSEEDDCDDLIAEWREPRGVTVDVYMVEFCGSVSGCIRKGGNVPPAGNILGKRLGITITEGDGMEEKQC